MRKRFKKTVPVLGAAAGLSLSLASSASAAPAADISSPCGGAEREIILAEEEISDVSLATFYVFDKETSAAFGSNIQPVRGGGCGGGGCRGCGGGGVEAAEALEAVAVAGVEVAEAAAGFGPMGAAELVWRVLDVHQSGGVSRRRLQCTPIRHRVGRRCHG
jgi:hypothetical protein